MNNKELIKEIIYFFFRELQDNYVVIKLKNNFPNLLEGDDIDIFIKNSSENIIEKLIIEIKSLYKITCNKKYISEYQTQLVFYKKNKELVLFDLYKSLPDYKVINIKKKYFNICIKNSINKKFTFNDKKINLKVLSRYDDYFIRYIEYFEYFWTGNEKSWHLELIMKNLNMDEYEQFYKYISYFIELPIIAEKKYTKILYYYKKRLYLRYYLRKLIESLKYKIKFF